MKDKYKADIVRAHMEEMKKDKWYMPRVCGNVQRNGADAIKNINLDRGALETLLVYYETDAPVTVYDPDPETPVSIYDGLLRADWYNAGEGWHGDYDPEDPEDDKLLRFDIYVKNTDEEWEEVDDASYCTRVPADTDKEKLTELLMIIFRRYRDAITAYPVENSVKKLGEELSWISPYAENKNKMEIEIKGDDMPEFVGQMIDIFEDFLSGKGIIIPSPEKDMDEDLEAEESVNIFGSDYDELADSIRATIQSWPKQNA